MKKSLLTFLVIGSVLLVPTAFATGICPSASQLNYSGGPDGMITPPAGWVVVPGYPTSPDNTPTKWLETGWTSYHGSIDIGDHTTCFYQVKGYQPNSGEGGWTIMTASTTSDPWYMQDRPAGWFDDGSHGTQQNPWDDCDASRTSCVFPTSAFLNNK